MKVGTISKLFLSLDGRIGRLQFWIGSIVLRLIESAIEWGLGVWTDGLTPRQRVIRLIAELIFAYPNIAISVKRLHDRNYSGATVWFLIAAFATLLVVEVLGYLDDLDHVGATVWIAIIAALIVAFGFLIELGFRRGTPGPNKYGPDPLGREAV
jgi:uncharacterized membrane protein YhaH (DUF805 family)